MITDSHAHLFWKSFDADRIDWALAEAGVFKGVAADALKVSGALAG